MIIRYERLGQTKLIRQAWNDNGKVYGYRKLHDDLLDQGETCCPNRVARLTRLAGIKAQIGYKRQPGSYGGKPSLAVDNILDRQFDIAAPDRAWVTDITYIRTLEGFVYLAVVIDLYSRRVVGWSMQSGQTTDAVLQALHMAVWRRKPKQRVLIHSDQGSQFTSMDWAAFIRAHNLEHSMSRRGNCHDNAVAESFFSSLIRDKIAASKAKGMWMGGPVPLGYRLENRVLHIEPTEAELIRHIFQRYLDLGSGRLVVAELDRDGHRSKARINRHGRAYGRQPISRGALYAILQNRLYIGEVIHKEHVYPGQHAPIIDIETFEAVQSRISLSRNERRFGTKAACPSLLAGLLWDDIGRRMTPSHAVKQQKRYRYYVSQTESHDDVATPAWRISASELEALVLDEIKVAIGAAVQDAVTGCSMRSDPLEVLRDRCGAAIDSLSATSVSQQRSHILDIVRRIDIGDGVLAITYSLQAIDQHLTGEHMREVAINMVRTGRQTEIVIPPPATQSAKPNPALLKLLAQAFAARAAMDKGSSFLEVAARLGCGREYLADLLRTSYLAPSIIKAIVEGRQPPELSRKRLMQTNRIPFDWKGQEAMFGFG